MDKHAGLAGTVALAFAILVHEDIVDTQLVADVIEKDGSAEAGSLGVGAGLGIHA